MSSRIRSERKREEIMNVTDLEHFKNILLEREHNLASWLDTPGTARDEDISKVRSLLGQIKDALGRVKDHSYGECKVCKGEVEHYRLEVQPATEVCLDCISKQDKQLLEEELFLASKIHRALLPQSAVRIDGFEIGVRSIAARTVGGDYYDFLSGNDDAVRVIIADTMGKGLPAGLLMSNIQGALRILAEDIESPAALTARLNRILCRNVAVVRFVSMVCFYINPRSGGKKTITFANAGHCPPILVRKKGDIETLPVTGGVLGVHEDFTFEQRDISLSTGDVLLLYTDGITEAENRSGEMFGEKRLLEFARINNDRPPETMIENLFQEVRSFSGKGELDDDCTVMALMKL